MGNTVTLCFGMNKASMFVPPPPPCRPPLVVPHPLSFPGGGLGDRHLVNPKSSLCCCVGDYVVGHCHLYPLYSWQDILLTFAEMELDSPTLRRQNHHPRVRP